LRKATAPIIPIGNIDMLPRASFIHEIPGGFVYRGTIGHVSTKESVLGVIEYVD